MNLGAGEDVEVVISALPELGAVAFQLLRGLGFEGAEDVFELVFFWFAEQQVDVLGHKDVAVNVEGVALTSGFEDFLEDGAGVVVVEVGEPLVATEGDEVVVVESVETLQTARHGVMVLERVGRVPHSSRFVR